MVMYTVIHTVLKTLLDPQGLTNKYVKVLKKLLHQAHL